MKGDKNKKERAVRIKYSNADYLPKLVNEDEWEVMVANHMAHFSDLEKGEGTSSRQPKRKMAFSPSKPTSGRSRTAQTTSRWWGVGDCMLTSVSATSVYALQFPQTKDGGRKEGAEAGGGKAVGERRDRQARLQRGRARRSPRRFRGAALLWVVGPTGMNKSQGPICAHAQLPFVTVYPIRSRRGRSKGAHHP